MDLTPLQQNFAAGEISPRFLCRSDVEAYRAGLDVMRNMFPYSQGPATRRPGMAYRDTYPGRQGRLFPFPVDINRGFVVTITDQSKLYVNDAEGRPLGENLVTNGDFGNSGTGWTTDEQGPAAVLFEQFLCTLTLGDAGAATTLAAIEQQVAITTQNADHNIVVTTNETGTNNVLRVQIGTTQGGSDLLNQTFVGDQFVAELNVGANANVWVRVAMTRADNAEGVIRTRQIQAVFLAELGQVGARIEFTTPAYTIPDLLEMQYAITPNGTTMYLFTRRHPPQKLIYNRTANTWDFQAVTYTNGPGEWTGNNWPGCVFFFEGRKWVGGTPNEPSTFWASAAGAYENFSVPSTDPQPDNALTFTMDRWQRIQWISGLREMMIGTDSGEWVVKSVDNDVLYYANIRLEQQSQHGSRRRQPLQVGNNIIFISPDGRKIRDTGYRWTEEAWVARDLTYVSEHITEDINIVKELHWAPNAENLIFAATAGGNYLMGVYEWNNNIVGWSRCDTEGEVVSMCVLELGGRSNLAVLTRRTNNGTPELHIETDDPFNYLDDNKTELLSGGQRILAANHLQGQLVGVTTDEGAVHPDVMISDGGPQGITNPDNLPAGQANLQWPTNQVTYGRRYTSGIRTLPLDIGIATGTASSTRKRRNKVYVRLLQSALPLIYGERNPDRTPSTPMNQPEPIFTGDRKVSHVGWDQFAQVTIEQDLPLPLTVLGIFGEAAVEKL